MKNNKFDQLLDRWLHNKTTPEETDKIEAWLDTMKREDASTVDLTDEEEEALFQKIISKRQSVKDVKEFRPKSLKSKIQTKWVLRIAAALVLFMAAGYVIWETRHQNIFGLHDVAMKKTTLNDGTIVWIKGDSRLSYYEKDNRRYAELEGEALFEVSKDSTRPFTIHMKEVEVLVMGTSFHLKTGDSVELKVLTGKVRMSSTTDKVGVEVVPNEQAVYTTAKGIAKSILPGKEALAIVNDTEYNMQFKDAEIASVMERMEKKFDMPIDITAVEHTACHVTLDITDHSLESSLEIIAAVLKVQYKISDKGIVFYGSGCK